MNQVFLSDSCYQYFGTSSTTTGAATNADSTPTVVVAEDGTDMGYSPTVTNVATGLYKVEIAATSGNGFEAGRRYNLYAVATVGGITGRDGIGEFEVLAVDLNTGVASVTGAVGSVTAAVTLPSIPADWITAAGIAADAITEIQAGLATATAVADVQADIDAIGGIVVTNLDVTVSSRLSAAAYTAPDNSSITGIKAKTDSLTFTLAGQVDSNVKSMNDVSVIGTGVAGDLWRA